jgi:hypothetical protein
MIEIRKGDDGVERAFALDRQDPLHQDNLPAWFDASKGCDSVHLVVFLAFRRQGVDPRTVTRKQVTQAIRSLDRTADAAARKADKEIGAALARWRKPV